jgi:hypothetical protein
MNDREQAINYFLGELNDDEQAAVEERFFTEEEFSAFLDEVETDLIDDYTRGELSATLKLKFEQNYLISERRRERVKAAAVLANAEKVKVKSFTAAPQVSFWEQITAFFRAPQMAFALSAAALLLLIGGLFVFWRPTDNEVAKIEEPTPVTNIFPIKQPSPALTPQISPENFPSPTPIPKVSVSPTLIRQPDRRETELQREIENQTIEREQPKPTPTPKVLPKPVFAFFTLLPTSRTGEKPQLTLKKNVKSVRLNLVNETSGDFAKYHVEVRDANGSVILAQETKSKKIGLNLPVARLKKGDYEITLSGKKNDGTSETLNFYEFSVVKN